MPSGEEILKKAMETEFKLYGLRDCDCGAKESEGEIDLQEDQSITVTSFSVVCFLCGKSSRSSQNKGVALDLWNMKDFFKVKMGFVAHDTTA